MTPGGPWLVAVDGIWAVESRNRRNRLPLPDAAVGLWPLLERPRAAVHVEATRRLDGHDTDLDDALREVIASALASDSDYWAGLAIGWIHPNEAHRFLDALNAIEHARWASQQTRHAATRCRRTAQPTTQPEPLRHPDPAERDRAVEELADVLRSGQLGTADALRIVARLIAVGVADADHTVRESALNAISEATTHRTIPLALAEPLRLALPRMDPALLDHTLWILAGTRDPAVRTTISDYVAHPDPAARAAAAEALRELDTPAS